MKLLLLIIGASLVIYFWGVIIYCLWQMRKYEKLADKERQYIYEKYGIWIDKLKELELQLNDLQNARLAATKDTGALRYQRLFLAVLAMVALFADIVAIQYVTDKMLNEILTMLLVILVWDIRQIYRFFFGSSDDLPNMGFKRK